MPVTQVLKLTANVNNPLGPIHVIFTHVTLGITCKQLQYIKDYFDPIPVKVKLVEEAQQWRGGKFCFPTQLDCSHHLQTLSHLGSLAFVPNPILI